jgi:hypothetical protein
MPGESAQGPLVSDDEDDDEDKWLFAKLVLAITGSLLPSEAEANKLVMEEDCPDELELEDLEGWVYGASRCPEEAALC